MGDEVAESSELHGIEQSGLKGIIAEDSTYRVSNKRVAGDTLPAHEFEECAAEVTDRTSRDVLNLGDHRKKLDPAWSGNGIVPADCSLGSGVVEPRSVFFNGRKRISKAVFGCDRDGFKSAVTGNISP